MEEEIKSYWLPPQEIRENKVIVSLDPYTRGVYRDLLDLMWLTNSKCSLPAKHEVIAERLGTPVKTLKKAISILSNKEINLLSVDKTPHGEYILCEFLRLQKGGVKKPQYIAEDKVVTKAIDLSEPDTQHIHRRYIDGEDLLITEFNGWVPTARFVTNGEAFVVTPGVRKEIQTNAGDVNLDFVFKRSFDWLMKSGNEDRRPTYANMIVFLIGFAKRSVRTKASAPHMQKAPAAAMSDDDFSNELAELLEGSN